MICFLLNNNIYIYIYVNLINELIDWFVNYMIDWLIDWLSDWLIHWLIDWVSEWVSDVYAYIRDIYIYIHMHIPASSNVCKIIAFSGIIAGGTFFCCQTIFAFFVISMCLPILKRRKTPTKRRKNPTKRRKKSRAQNVQTETAKKTGNDENLSSRR